MSPTLEQYNKVAEDYLPGYLGIVMTHVALGEAHARLQVRKNLMSPTGFLDAGSVVTLANTAAGYGCYASLPQTAIGFATVELKSNYLDTARNGTVACVAKAINMNNLTQEWEVTITHQPSGRTLAFFHCVQKILYSK